LLKYREKLIAKKVQPERRVSFLRSLAARGILVSLALADIVPRVLADPDDDVFLACALAGAPLTWSLTIPTCCRWKKHTSDR